MWSAVGFPLRGPLHVAAPPCRTSGRLQQFQRSTFAQVNPSTFPMPSWLPQSSHTLASVLHRSKSTQVQVSRVCGQKSGSDKNARRSGDLSVGTGGLPPTCISSVVSKGHAIWCIRSSHRSRVWHLHMPVPAQPMSHIQILCRIFAATHAPTHAPGRAGCRCNVLQRDGVAEQSTAAAAVTGADARAAACMRRG